MRVNPTLCEFSLSDFEDAACQFIGLVQNRYFKARLYNFRSELTAREIETEVAAAVESFLRAFRPE